MPLLLQPAAPIIRKGSKCFMKSKDRISEDKFNSKWGFVISCIGGAIGGAFIGLMGTRSFAMGGLGLFGLPSYIDATGGTGIQNMIYVIIGTIIASVIGFVLTWFLYKDEDGKKA